MKRFALFLAVLVLMTACSRSASKAQPTEPALDFPSLDSSETPRCRPADLETSSNFNGSNGAVVLGVTLTNSTRTSCTLSNPPLPRMLDAKSEPLGLDDMEIAPAQTPPAPALMKLTPGESAIVTLIWQNYCRPVADSGLILRLDLGDDQNLDVEMDMQSGPQCESEKEPSTLIIAPYSYPP